MGRSAANAGAFAAALSAPASLSLLDDPEALVDDALGRVFYVGSLIDTVDVVGFSANAEVGYVVGSSILVWFE